MKKLKRLVLALILVASISSLVSFVLIYFCNRTIDHSAEGKLYSNASQIPFNKVGLLLGTGKYLSDGSINPYFLHRIEAATTLMQSGKIKYLIISGDNSRVDYNEPQQMKSDLIQRGIDSTKIYLDYAGFRTFDSMVRLKKIFGQDSVTVISQAFHNERAIYIACKENITAIGFNAEDVGSNLGAEILLREKLARVKVFIDFIFGTSPRFLGERVMIP